MYRSSNHSKPRLVSSAYSSLPTSVLPQTLQLTVLPAQAAKTQKMEDATSYPARKSSTPTHETPTDETENPFINKTQPHPPFRSEDLEKGTDRRPASEHVHVHRYSVLHM
jgi:hypothetical protein